MDRNTLDESEAVFPERSAWPLMLTIFLSLSFLGLSEWLYQPLGIDLDPFYFPLIITLGLAYGLRAALVIATASALLVMGRFSMLAEPSLPTSLNVLLFIPSLYLSALLVSQLRNRMFQRFARQRDAIRALHHQAEHRAEQLAVLYRLGQDISRRLDVDSVYSAIYASVSHLMDCDAFGIVRYESGKVQYEVVYCVAKGQRLPSRLLPLGQDLISGVLHSGQELVTNPQHPDPHHKVSGYPTLESARALLCVPLIVGQHVVGALWVQRNRPEAYTQNDVELLNLLAAQAGVALENARHYTEARENAARLGVLNRVAHLFSSSLEMDRVMELIYEQVSLVMQADSYFLASIDIVQWEMDFQFLVDGDEIFPPHKEPIGSGLSAWVVRNRVPLLLNNVLLEAEAMGIEVVMSGAQRASKSWLGVPLLTGNDILGLLVVAHYETNRFTPADAALLQNIAQQAAIALDNARQHAMVQEQARLDSLTQVYNHGHLIKRLTTEVERTQSAQQPLTLIMLDIDHFKKYNDTYGHRVGDAVLIAMASAIRSHVRQQDIVGRWGGEEFGIVLPEAEAIHALEVARRISTSLKSARIYDEDGHQITPPTVSQGIATIPDHANNVDTLILLADQALYEAKHTGRNQICFAMHSVYKHL